MKANINVGESMAIALQSLRQNKLRSFLTLIGIIIGVTTVITVVTIIQGLNRYVKYQIFAFGSNTFTVHRAPEIITNLKLAQEYFKRKRIEYDDFLYLRDNAQQCEAVEAQYPAAGLVKYRNKLLQEIQILGETTNFHLTGRAMELDDGRFLIPTDEQYARRVCFVGQGVKKELFAGENPLGKWIMASGQKFQVIGCAKGLGKILGFSLDNFVTIPISTFRKYYPVNQRDITINVKARDIQRIPAAKEEIRTIMRNRRKLDFKTPDDFTIEDSQTFIDFYNNLTGTLYIAMVIIASISMLVGGIVIMNIMLVAVTERIREIGIRKAVGARRRDILLQFLIESSSISGVGGIIGIIQGFIFAKIIAAFTSLPAALEWWSVVLALVMSASIGLFFGIYPANRAAKLDPVVALREE